MNIFLRTFNDSINSKTGAPLPTGAPRRGTPEWLVFQKILMQTLKEIEHKTVSIDENPREEREESSFYSSSAFDKRIYVHQCKRDKPGGDLFWMQMHMRYLFTVDSNGWGADHSQYPEGMKVFANEDESVATDFCQNLSDTLLASKDSKCPQPDITDMTPSRFILVPVQIPRDYTIKWHSPITVRYFIDSIQAWAVETENHVVFKMHPHNTMDIDLRMAVDNAASQSRYIHRAEGNIHELIKRSSGLFVINSGVGFEALVHGKPVCTFGTSDYNLCTHNADLRRLDEARNFIYSYREEWKRTAYKFVYYYHTKHAYDVRFPEDCKQRLTEYLKETL